MSTDAASEQPRLQSLEEFYAQDERRQTHGFHQFGFNWKDPNVSDQNCYCEVHWYFGTHEIAAVYQTIDPARLAAVVGQGMASAPALDALSRALVPVAGPVAGPAAADQLSAIGIARMLGDR